MENKGKGKGVGRVGGWGRDRQRNRLVNAQALPKLPFSELPAHKSFRESHTNPVFCRLSPSVGVGKKGPFRNGASSQEWPRQTKPKKGQFMNFSQGHSGTKVQCKSCLFSQGKTPEFTKMGEIHELFVWALRLVWFAGATPDLRKVPLSRDLRDSRESLEHGKARRIRPSS